MDTGVVEAIMFSHLPCWLPSFAGVLNKDLIFLSSHKFIRGMKSLVSLMVGNHSISYSLASPVSACKISFFDD